MSGFTCPSCGDVTHIFHRGGGAAAAVDLGVPFLGAIPLDPAIVDGGDDGIPLVVTVPDSPAAQAFGAIADALSAEMRPSPGIRVPFDWTIADGSGKPAPVKPSGPTDRPLALDYDSTGLIIRWSDRTQHIDPRDLRLSCSCASCRDEMTGAPLLVAQKVPLGVAPVRIYSVGNYALGVTFSDGHGSGIFTFEALRDIEAPEVEDV
jgi:ATP-binding protein involved in chromosome partitioning